MNEDDKITYYKKKAASSILWTGIDQFSGQGLQFVISIILARLLSPEEFGIIGMLAIFTGIASVFVDSGFTSALIQKRNLSEEETSSVFFFNLFSAFIMGLILCASASWISRFYRMPILEPLTYVMSLNLLLSAFGSVQRALMNIDLDFKTPTKINLATTLVSSTVGISLAWRGYGVWSLAFQSLTATLLVNVLIWYYRPWRPAFSFDFRSVTALYRFGGFMMLSGLLDIVYTRMSTLLIGKLYSASDLGFYSRADRTRQLPGGIIASLVDRVAFPLFAAAKSDSGMLGRGLKKSVTTLMMVNLPLMLGLAAVSRPLVLTLFGVKWEACIPYLQVLSFVGIFWPLHVVNLSVLKAQGRSDLFFRLEVLKKVIGFSALFVACPFGVLAMACSQVFSSFICFMINAHYSGKFLGHSAWAQLRDILPYGLVSLVMALCVWLLSFWQGGAVQLVLVLQLITGAALYTFLCSILRLACFQETIAHLRTGMIRGLGQVKGQV